MCVCERGVRIGRGGGKLGEPYEAVVSRSSCVCNPIKHFLCCQFYWTSECIASCSRLLLVLRERGMALGEMTWW